MTESNDQTYVDLMAQRKAVVRSRGKGWEKKAKALLDKAMALEGVSNDAMTIGAYL